MTTYHNLPRRPLVDLTSDYLGYLDGIDAENQSRHRQGVSLVDYPTFEEFIELCAESSFDAEAKTSPRLHKFEDFACILDTDTFEEPDMSWILPHHLLDIETEEDELVGAVSFDEPQWVTSHGSFAFISSSKH